MLNGISKHKFYVMSQLVRLRGTQTAQTAHCALQPAWGRGGQVLLGRDSQAK